MEAKEEDMSEEAKFQAKEEGAVMAEDGVDKTTKMHTNLRSCIIALLPKLTSTPMKIGRISVTNSVV